MLCMYERCVCVESMCACINLKKKNKIKGMDQAMHCTIFKKVD